MMFYMYILPLKISEEKWAEVWDSTLELIRSWNLPLIRPGYRRLCGVPVPVFTDPEDGEDGYWEIFGEDRWGTTAGIFGLYRDLGRYLRWGSEVLHKQPLLPEEPSGRRQYIATPFEHTHRGRPYVVSLVAVGMLIEDAFGENAVITGDFDWNDVLLATEQLERIFGKTFPPPRVTKKSWARDRFADTYQGEELSDFVNSLTVHPTEEPISRWFYMPEYRGRKTFSGETPKVVRELYRLAGPISDALPNDHNALLRQLAENMLVSHVRVHASVVESVLPSLDVKDLKLLVGLTDPRLSSRANPWRGPLVEDEGARNRIKREIEAEDVSH